MQEQEKLKPQPITGSPRKSATPKAAGLKSAAMGFTASQHAGGDYAESHEEVELRARADQTEEGSQVSKPVSGMRKGNPNPSKKSDIMGLEAATSSQDQTSNSHAASRPIIVEEGEGGEEEQEEAPEDSVVLLESAGFIEETAGQLESLNHQLEQTEEMCSIINHREELLQTEVTKFKSVTQI
jgi:hypothetical protein